MICPKITYVEEQWAGSVWGLAEDERVEGLEYKMQKQIKQSTICNTIVFCFVINQYWCMANSQ